MKQKIELNTIAEAIEELKNGHFIIVVDNEQRENEGDLIIAAEMITTEKVNFMETYARGLICAPLTGERCDELNLSSMVTENTSAHCTPFTISVDLLERGCTTGISAYDRAQTLLALCNDGTKPNDLARPGHIFPLRAHKDGVHGRPGHTEAVVDLLRLAGMSPVGVLIEIKNEDGSMSRLPDLMIFAKKHSLKIISIFDLILYTD